MRKRLVELVDKAKKEYASDVTDYTETDYIVECLLNEGVIVPPCKVGDVVYRIYTRAWIGEDVVREVVVSENGVFYIDDKGRMTSCNKFGKTVFLTKEDAERKMRGNENSKRYNI